MLPVHRSADLGCQSSSGWNRRAEHTASILTANAHPRSLLFFFNDTAPTEISPLPLHDALPISAARAASAPSAPAPASAAKDAPPAEPREATFSDLRVRSYPSFTRVVIEADGPFGHQVERSEEHTSELQSQSNLVCRLLLEKKKK